MRNRSYNKYLYQCIYRIFSRQNDSPKPFIKPTISPQYITLIPNPKQKAKLPKQVLNLGTLTVSGHRRKSWPDDERYFQNGTQIVWSEVQNKGVLSFEGNRGLLFVFEFVNDLICNFVFVWGVCDLDVDVFVADDSGIVFLMCGTHVIGI